MKSFFSLLVTEIQNVYILELLRVKFCMRIEE